MGGVLDRRELIAAVAFVRVSAALPTDHFCARRWSDRRTIEVPELRRGGRVFGLVRRFYEPRVDCGRAVAALKPTDLGRKSAIKRHGGRAGGNVRISAFWSFSVEITAARPSVRRPPEVTTREF